MLPGRRRGVMSATSDPVALRLIVRRAAREPDAQRSGGAVRQTDPMDPEGRRWVWTRRPEAYPDLDLPEASWCCASATRAGDVGVVYRSREHKDLSHLVVVGSDAERCGGRTPVCRVLLVARFPEPLPLARMRADPVLRQWPALRAGFVQRCFPVPDAVWARLCELLPIDRPAGP